MIRSFLRVTLLVVLPCVAAQAQLVGRLLDGVDVSGRRGHVDISLIFGCGLRYVSHSPASEGQEMRLRFVALPDCGDLTRAVLSPPPTLGGTSIIRSIELDQLGGNTVELTLQLDGPKQFVLAPTADSHGLRIRLLDTELEKSRVFVGEPTGPPAAYAVNLDSAQQAFEPDALEEATQVTGVPAYASESVLGDHTWYRLRIGPFSSEVAARNALNQARKRYPRAWLAIGDDERLNAPNAESVKSADLPGHPQSNATLTDKDIALTLDKARKAFRRKDYATAIPLLTKLLAQPEFPRRAEVQEMLGLARERNRQLAHAKAEYEEYLRRYPDGRAVNRVRERLRALALASRPSRAGMAGDGDQESAWRIYGGASQIYRHDTTQLDNAALSTSLVSQHALLNDFDIVARRRGERFDLSMRASAGYQKDLLEDGPGDQTRVSAAFIELGDRTLDWSARAGRQTRNTGGLFGTFDGLSAGYQLRPRLRASVAFGFPVDTARDSLQTGREFVGLSAEFGTFADAWDVAIYGLSQRIEGSTDRQAIGTELRYFQPGRTLVALVDYDFHFQQLNNALIVGTLALPARFTLGLNLDHRKSPSLSLRNALIGQPVGSFEDLLGLFTPEELYRIALDRSADSDLYSLSLSRPFGERWQWTLDVSRISTGGTPASGGVDAVPEFGTETAYALQGMVSGLFGGSALTFIDLRQQSSSSTQTRSIGLSSRLPLWGAWRISPRLRVDERQFRTDGSHQVLYVPTLRLDWQRSRMLLELEAGAEVGKRELGTSREETTRYYLSAGYRMNF